jgi:MFS family permease
MFNSATRIVASTLGVLAGLFGIEHGYFETLQGNGAPGGIYILAMGPPCQTNKMWHGCEPAMTIIPNFFVTGVIAIIVSFIVIVWAAVFVQRKHGGLVLILLSIIQLLVGGGLVPLALGITAGVAGTRIYEPFTWWRAHLSVHARSFLAALWPWSLIAFVVWFPGEWILGYFFNEYLLNLTLFTMFFSLALMLLTVLTAFAHDIQRQTDSYQVPSMSG